MRSEIPFIVHQVWIQGGRDTMPVHIRVLTEYLEQHVIQEGGTYYLWKGSDFHNMIRSFSPHLYRMYQSAPSLASQSDMIQMFVLYAYGGIYVDTDMFLLQPSQLRWLISGPAVDVVVPYLWEDGDAVGWDGFNQKSPYCTNNCLVAAPQASPIVERFLRRMEEAPLFHEWPERDEFVWTMTCTGPGVIERVLFDGQTHPEDRVRLLPRTLLPQPLEMIQVASKQIRTKEELTTLLRTLRQRFPTAILLHGQECSWIPFPVRKVVVWSIGVLAIVIVVAVAWRMIR